MRELRLEGGGDRDLCAVPIGQDVIAGDALDESAAPIGKAQPGRLDQE
ncbi:hypothetical protein ACFQ07_21425 [Actinomadura adrarensis]|uniref:Uncharacterized protein n=1 Tax=Actinomadura adrarensis TaxID=1819600 RepID=A0ABW3CKK5_9ACTN